MSRIDKKLEEFDERVAELKNDFCFCDGAETKTHEFGYKTLLTMDEVKTNVDFGNIRNFVCSALEEQERELMLDEEEVAELLRTHPAIMASSNLTKKKKMYLKTAKAICKLQRGDQ